MKTSMNYVQGFVIRKRVSQYNIATLYLYSIFCNDKQKKFTFFRDLQKSITTLLEDIESERTKHATQSIRYSHKNKPEKTREKGDTVKRPVVANNNKKSIIDNQDTPENQTCSRVSSSTTISGCITDNSLSTLKTFDNIDFQNDLLHLEAKIDVVGNTLQQQKNVRVT